MATFKPSSGTAGFFQERPKLQPQYEDNTALRRIAELYIPSAHQKEVVSSLISFSSAVISPQIFSYITNAESHLPYISSHSTFGHPRSTLYTSEGWRALSAFGIEHGIVSAAYDEPQLGHVARISQFLKYHVWTPSCAITTCPGAMADGAARLLSRHVDSVKGPEAEVFKEAYEKLISRDTNKAWTSGQWMTERSGGSDIRGTETVATLLSSPPAGKDNDGMPLGPWSISGFKWFSSATDSNMAILLAKTAKGISTFYAPTRLANGELNGISIQRLKPKMGTKPLPTAELVLDGMRGYLIGEEGQGTKEISAILNITRLHTAISALGFWGRSLAISRAFAKVRKLSTGTTLENTPAHVRTMAKNTINYTAMMHLGFFTAAMLGIAEHPKAFDETPESLRTVPVADSQEAILLSRLITPVAKAICSKRALAGIQECMESLGGVGYMEDEQEYNIARLFRDANVLSIWEGTTDVLAHDVIRVVTGRTGMQVKRAFNNWVRTRIGTWGMEWASAEELIRAESGKVDEWWTVMKGNELAYKGREVLEMLGWIVASVMLVEDARRDGDIVATEIARRWVLRKEADLEAMREAWRRDFRMDQRIVFPSAGSETSKL